MTQLYIPTKFPAMVIHGYNGAPVEGGNPDAVCWMKILGTPHPIAKNTHVELTLEDVKELKEAFDLVVLPKEDIKPVKIGRDSRGRFCKLS